MKRIIINLVSVGAVFSLVVRRLSMSRTNEVWISVSKRWWWGLGVGLSFLTDCSFFRQCLSFSFFFFYLRTLRKTKDYRCLTVTADAIIQHKETTASYFFNFLLNSADILKK